MEADKSDMDRYPVWTVAGSATVSLDSKVP